VERVLSRFSSHTCHSEQRPRQAASEAGARCRLHIQGVQTERLCKVPRPLWTSLDIVRDIHPCPQGLRDRRAAVDNSRAAVAILAPPRRVIHRVA
jgi:hypothetical protein